MLGDQRPKILLDECLSPQVARHLCHLGWDAVHVMERNLRGKSDLAVFNWAYEGDRIIMTANFLDFEKLAKNTEMHCGIIGFANGEMTRAEQLEIVPDILEQICTAIPNPMELANQVILVNIDGTWNILKQSLSLHIPKHY